MRVLVLNLNCCYEKMQAFDKYIYNSLRARSISRTYQPAFFHLAECATYIDQSDWPIQTVIVQVCFTHCNSAEPPFQNTLRPCQL